MGSRGKHVNVLQHLMGFLKNHLSSEDKQELLGLIEDYRQGLLPLIVPLTLLKHHLNRYPVPDWVHQQVYLHPYPKELMLRNHVQQYAVCCLQPSAQPKKRHCSEGLTAALGGSRLERFDELMASDPAVANGLLFRNDLQTSDVREVIAIVSDQRAIVAKGRGSDPGILHGHWPTHSLPLDRYASPLLTQFIIERHNRVLVQLFLQSSELPVAPVADIRPLIQFCHRHEG
jgi:hypothetical protein